MMQKESSAQSLRIRPELMMWAHALEKQMRYNETRGKTDQWKEDHQEFLYFRLTQEMRELAIELKSASPEQKKVRHESCDVGALAFFIWYNSLMRTAEGIAPQDGENR